MSVILILLICFALSLDILRSAFFFNEQGYPPGYRIKEAMMRTALFWTGGVMGWLVNYLLPETILRLDFALLMLTGVKMIWSGIQHHPFDDDDRYSPGAPLLMAQSINAFLAGLAFGIAGMRFWIGALAIGLFTFTIQTISLRFTKGKLPRNHLFRPVVAGGFLIIIVAISYYLFL